MYDIGLLLHSWNRWILVLLTLWVLVEAVRAVGGKGTVCRKVGLFWLISADVQLLLGFILYGLSPYITQLREVGMGEAMRSPILRFWTVEHLTTAMIAIVLIHVAFKTIKKQGSPKKILGLTIAALVFLAATIPWPFLAHGRSLFRLIG
jgi:hypothetical protein